MPVPDRVSLHALVDGRVIGLRVPYPMGFFAKGIDGRIDDPNAGWKGRGLWVTSGNRTPMHIEGIDAPAPGAPHSGRPPSPLFSRHLSIIWITGRKGVEPVW